MQSRSACSITAALAKPQSPACRQFDTVAFTLATYGHVLPGQQADAAAAVAALVDGRGLRAV